MMDLTTYQKAAIRTAKLYGDRHLDLRHASLGMLTEAGEFATDVKRNTIYGTPYDEKMLKNMRKELGDFAWYVALYAHITGVNLADHSAAPEDVDFPTGIDGFWVAANGAVMLVAFSAWNDGSEPPPADVIQVALYAIDQACAAMGWDRGEILQQNIDKLRERYPDAYSDYHAEARLDTGGLDAHSS